MENYPLYKELLKRIDESNLSVSDFPDETTVTTIRALWNTAAGIPLSASKAQSAPLPELTSENRKNLETLIKQRISGVPLAHLTGRIHFMNLELIIEPGVLIARPETELLGFTVVEWLRSSRFSSEHGTGIDIGCGSGNLSCGIASHYSGLRLYAVDITDECVDCAKKNISLNKLNDRVTIYKGDLFSPLAGLHLEMNTDIVISNPPYIPSAKLQSDLSHLVKHEPQEAFNGGIYGFSLHHRLIKESLRFLKPGGVLFFEFGIGQEKQVQALFNRVAGYMPVAFKNDKNNNPRVAIATKK
jgi:release factor glutamine methyltransferase